MAFQRLRKLLAVFALVLILGACGGDPETEETSDPDLNLESDPSGELSGKLLSAADMPAGWQPIENTGTEEVSAQEGGFCDSPIPDESNATASATAQFFKGEMTNRVVQTVVSYESPEAATEAFDKVQQA